MSKRPRQSTCWKKRNEQSGHLFRLSAGYQRPRQSTCWKKRNEQSGHLFRGLSRAPVGRRGTNTASIFSGSRLANV
ncbi:uncharacterized protein LOC141785752 isoform X2 [Halichoeres trimaculatus]|uniref:uncharacterized protein LOC141785752 isoform X2 n=1 Tax=Halichoeres trimaculatus TaxID=147232 RepID=UPI003D9E028A